MASPRLLTQQDFTQSRYESLGDDANNLGAIIRRAEDIIGDMIGMELAKAVYTDVETATGSNLFLSVRPIVTVTSLSKRMYDRSDWTLIPSDTYVINATQGILAARSDVTLSGYQYQAIYEAGYTPITLPEALREAILIQTALLLFQDFEIYGAGDSKPPGIDNFYADIQRYIRPHIRSRLVRF